MKPVICFGEALIDFLNVDQQQQDKLNIKGYRQFPGGAPANAAVSVAKLGGDAFFAGQVGKDAFGDFLLAAMQDYGVNVSFCHQHATAPTALAFVMLDKDNDRSFTFYRDSTADMIFSPSQIDSKWFARPSIFHFCSNTLTDDNIAYCTEQALVMAKANDALVSFDVNLRHNLWPTGRANRAQVNRLVLQAEILKFSAEELEFLADGNQHQYIKQCFAHGCRLLIITDGGGDVRYITERAEFSAAPPEVIVADTTGGGDGFIGALLFLLSLLDDLEFALNDSPLLSNIIYFACCCGAIAVSTQGAFPAFAQFEQAMQLFQTNNNSISHHFTHLIESI